MIDVTVGLLLAATHAVDTDLGLNYVHKVVEASTGGADWGLDIILSTGVAGVQAVGSRVDLPL